MNKLHLFYPFFIAGVIVGIALDIIFNLKAKQMGWETLAQLSMDIGLIVILLVSYIVFRPVKQDENDKNNTL